MKFLSAITTVLIFSSVASAQLNVVSHWRLGEDDAGAKSGAAITEATDRSVAQRHLKPVAGPTYSDAVSPLAKGSTLSASFDGKTQALQRKGLTDMPDNFVAEAFVRPSTDEGFHVILQYGSGGHGWSLIRNGKGYQVLLGGKALIGWSGDVASGEWAHVAVARVDGSIRFFFNGKPSGDGNQEPNQAGADATFTIGANNELKDCFGGEIDEVRVSTFPAGSFNPDVLMVNDPDGENAKRPAARATPKEGAPADAAFDGEAASIVFDAEPVASNMTFHRGGLSATDVAGKAAWVAQNGSATDVPWARSVLITLTDPSLREGRQPVVDVEVEYRQTFDAPVELRADTTEGSKKVGGGWGRNEGWQKFTARIDNAFFGARQHGHKPSDMDTDGYDLRINSFGGDFAIRSIKVRAYDLKGNPDYKRVIRFDGLETAKDLLIIAPGESADVQYKFSNLATQDAPFTYRHEVTGLDEKVRQEDSGEFTAVARSATPLKVSLSAKDLPLGAYRTHLSVLSADGAVVFERRGGFAVADDSPVARAKPGEFLYGLDVRLGAAYESPRLVRWAQFMGADIIRHGFSGQSLGELETHLPTYDAAGLRVMLMCDPPKTQDPNDRAKQLAEKTQYLQTAAEKFPQIAYYELGNEPDLTFFYPGPIESYAEDFQVMYDAIKRGNPAAQVLNGGLSFAGAEATQRATRFIEVVDPAKIDVWSYHGHGPGQGAEASALNRIRDLVRMHDKLKPFADTESGVAAQTPAQELVQARTVVQKMAFAQSEGLPFLMFFRLLMFEEAYGMLYSEQEPRPSVVAYSNLVRTMRGQRFEATLPSLGEGLTGYTFKDETATTRSAVLWSDSSGTRRLQFTLATPAGTKLRQVDLYGNATDVTVTPDGSFAVDVSADPTYLKWTNAAGAGALGVTPPALDVPSDFAVRDAGADVLAVTIVSRDDQPVRGTLRVTAGDKAGVVPAQTEFPVDVAAGKSVVVRVPVNVRPAAGAVEWPKQWTTFLAVDDAKVDITKLTDIPESLPGRAGAVAGKRALVRNDRVDFEQLGGTIRERETAVLMATVTSATDQTVRVGASADWWMQWTVNGQPVYSTLERGNGGGYSINDHTFDLPLKKGENLIAVKAQSGSMGWKILIGSPDALLALAGDPAESGVRFDLDLPGRSPQTAVAALHRMPAMQALAGDAAPTLNDLDAVQPDIVLLDHVDNAYAKMPDATKWWRGAADLSARGWVRQADGKLVIALAVTDDVHHPAVKTDAVEQGDAVRFYFADSAGLKWSVAVAPGESDGSAACAVQPAAGNATAPAVTATATSRREGQTTFYVVNLASTDAAARPDTVNVDVFDQDDVAAKQRLSLAPLTATGTSGWYRLLWPNP